MIDPRTLIVSTILLATGSFIGGIQAHKVLSDREIAKMESDSNKKIADAQKKTAEAQAAARETEHLAANKLHELEVNNANRLLERDLRNRTLAASADGMRKRIAELTASAGSCPASPASSSGADAASVLGGFAEGIDRFAEKAAGEAELLKVQVRGLHEYINNVVLPTCRKVNQPKGASAG